VFGSALTVVPPLDPLGLDGVTLPPLDGAVVGTTPPPPVPWVGTTVTVVTGVAFPGSVGILVALGSTELVAGTEVKVGISVGTTVVVSVGTEVSDGIEVAGSVGIAVAVAVAVAVFVGTGVLVAVGSGVFIGVPVAVAVAVGTRVSVAVGTRVSVAVGFGVSVGVLVGVGGTSQLLFQIAWPVVSQFWE
jgi:hypothetical protein